MGQACLDDLTESQTRILNEFRDRLGGQLLPIYDSYYLLRFLKARNFNLVKAEEMIREHFKLRKKVGAENLENYEIPEVFQKYLSYQPLGFDINGNLVVAHMLGLFDLKGLWSSTTYGGQVKQLMYYMETMFEKMRVENKKTGKNGRTLVTINDLAGLNLRALLDRAIMKNIFDLVVMFQANFPEVLYVVYLINVPPFFPTWFNLVKKLLDTQTLKKIKVYANDDWQRELFEYVDPEIVPAMYGGKLTDPDGNGKCLTILNRDMKIPFHYYLGEASNLSKRPDMTKATIRERTYFNFHADVREPDTLLKWTFQTIDYNIGFAVYFVPSGVRPMPVMSMPKFNNSFRQRQRRNSREGHEILLPLERVDSQCIPEQGEIVCEKTGTYLLHFDNTFSWLTPKDLHYKIEIIPPNTVNDV